MSDGKPPRDEPGRLWPGVTSSRVIDRWTFESAHTKDERIKVEVSLRQTAAGLVFDAKSPALPDGQVSGSDIDELHRRTAATLRRQEELRTGIVWEDWLEVRVGGYQRGALGHELRVEYSPLRRGRHPQHPEVDLTLTSQGHAIPFPQAKRAGDQGEERTLDVGGKVWRLGSDRDQDTEYAFLPDTPENRAALDHLIASLRRLRAQLSDFLSHDKIEQSITVVREQQWPQLEPPNPPDRGRRLKL